METDFIQTLAAGVIVGASVAFLGRRAWRTVANAKQRRDVDGACGAGDDCGCATPAKRTAPDA
jgi:hypothetical protein